MWRKGKPPTLLVEMKVGAATMENNVEVPQKAKSRTNIRSSSLTHGHTPGQIYNSKRYMWRPTPRPWVQGLVPRIQMWSPAPMFPAAPVLAGEFLTTEPSGTFLKRAS